MIKSEYYLPPTMFMSFHKHQIISHKLILNLKGSKFIKLPKCFTTSCTLNLALDLKHLYIK